MLLNVIVFSLEIIERFISLRGTMVMNIGSVPADYKIIARVSVKGPTYILCNRLIVFPCLMTMLWLHYL